MTFFLCADLVKADGLYITDGCDKADSTFDILCAGFEFGWKLGVGGFLLMDILDHVAAHQEWLHVVQELFLAIEDADAAHRAHFVPGEGEEVAV